MKKLILNIEINQWGGISEVSGWDLMGNVLISQSTDNRLFSGDYYYLGSKISKDLTEFIEE